ncbi:uncharacterized protein DUF4185 [Salana multivorans]|uniref:Uncharacterized protein DUF4185 n=1 Tax=Salana multivorans TaxID=120377 RepID=A0A3N2D9T4_9MICO|nr:DUF4185 domain-containing protein [Salana multivorans]ROR96557.1 uncharacterized protein DUF4185 [Salana multivorans]
MTIRRTHTTGRWRRLLAAGLGSGLVLSGAALAAGPATAEPVSDPAAAPADLGSYYSEGYEHPSAVRLVSQLTGAKGLTPTVTPYRIGGTDLGTMWDNGAGEVLFAVGDTFGNWSGSGGGGSDWRSNALLRSSNADWQDTGMTFSSAASLPDGKAKEIIPSLKQPGVEHTTIPTGGIAVDGVQYLSFMSVNRWGDPGQWFTNYSRIAYSSDNGETWNSVDGPQWDNDAEWKNKFQMVAFTHGQGDGFVYMFGTENGRFGPVHVGRVPEGQILEKDAYTYWDGAAWVEDDADAAPLAPAPVTELSVQYNDYIGKWMMMYTTDSEDEGIFDLVFRTADRPEGPWSDVTVVGTSLDLPGLYAPFLHPWNEGPEVHFTLSLWGPYNVFQYAFTLDEDGNLINPNLIEDPTFSRSAPGAMSPAWSCTGQCGIDHNPSWGYGSEKQAWMRWNAGWIDVHQEVTVEPNTRYLLTSFVTTGPANPPVTVTGELGVRPTGPGASPLGTAEFTNVNGYKRFQVEFDSGPYTSVEAYVGTNLQGDRWVQTTSFSLVKVGEGEQPPVAVVPPAPQLVVSDECGVEATVVLPEDVEGVAYATSREGTVVTVTATAAEGYVIADGATSTWTFDVAAAVCPSPTPSDDPTDEPTGGPTDPDPTGSTGGPTGTTTSPGSTPSRSGGSGGSGGGLAGTGAAGVSVVAVLALAAAGTGLWLRRRSMTA